MPHATYAYRQIWAYGYNGQIAGQPTGKCVTMGASTLAPCLWLVKDFQHISQPINNDAEC